MTELYTPALTNMELSDEVPASVGSLSTTQPIPVPTRLPKQAGTPDHNTQNTLTHNKQPTQPTSYLDPRLSHSEALSAFFSSEPDNTPLTIEKTESDHGECPEPQTIPYGRGRLSLLNKATRIGGRRFGRKRSRSQSSSSSAGSSVGSGVHWGNIHLPPSHLLSEPDSTQTYQQRGLTKSATWSESLHHAYSSGAKDCDTTPLEGSVNPGSLSRPSSPQQDTGPRSILVGSPKKTHSRRHSDNEPLKVRFSEKISYTSPDSGKHQSPSPSPDSSPSPATSSHTTSQSGADTGSEGVEPPAAALPNTFPVTKGTTIALRRKGKTKIRVYNPTYADLPPIVEHEPGIIPPPLRPLPAIPNSFKEIIESTQEHQARIARMEKREKRVEEANKHWKAKISANKSLGSDSTTYQMEDQQLGQDSAHPGTYSLESHTQAASGVRDPLGRAVDADDANDDHGLPDGRSLYHNFRFSDAERITDSSSVSDGVPCPLTPIEEERSSIGSQNNSNDRIAALSKMPEIDQEEEAGSLKSPGSSTTDLSRVGPSERSGTTEAPNATEEPTRITTPSLMQWAEASYEATTETARAVVTTRPVSRHMQVDITTAGPSGHRFSLDDDTAGRSTTTASALRTESSSAPRLSFGTPQQAEQRSRTGTETFDIGLPPQLPPIRLQESMHHDLMEWTVLGASTPPSAAAPTSSSSRGYSRADFQTPPDARIQQQLQTHLLTPSRSRGPVRSAAALAALVEEEVERHQEEQRSRPMGYAEVAALARQEAEMRERLYSFPLRVEDDVRRLVRYELMWCSPLFESAAATPERLRHRALAAATEALEEQHGDAAGYRIAPAATNPRPSR